MATSDQIRALIQSHNNGNHQFFHAITLQIIANAEKNGHTKFAQELRTICKKENENILPDNLAGLLSVAYPKIQLSDMTLADSTQNRLKKILEEYKQASRLHEYGLKPTRKILLIGPPGTGKTMTAAVLAGELNLPLFSIRLDGIINQFLGQTAANLRKIFNHIPTVQGVYLFDELDALGTDRGTRESDNGEIRRILNSLLQFLEQDTSESLILGATNYTKLLDHALFRRFDTIIDYSLPTHELAVQIMKKQLTLLNTTDVNWDQITIPNLSYAEIILACTQLARNTILNNETSVNSHELIGCLNERQANPNRNLPCL